MSGSGRAGRLRFMGKYIDHRLVARPEPYNTFWDDSTFSPKGIGRFWSQRKAPPWGKYIDHRLVASTEPDKPS